MNQKIKILITSLLFFLLILPVFIPAARAEPANDRDLSKRLLKRMERWENPLKEWKHVGKIRIDSVSAIQANREIRFFFSAPLSYIPVREETSKMLKESLRKPLNKKMKKWSLAIFTDNHPLEELIPNSLRSNLSFDMSRMPDADRLARIPVVKKLSSEPAPAGLYNNNIALWSSHGYYYESKLDRWEWQRARLFGTVEEMFTKSVTLPFLVAMLENSGATVWLPAERDWQTDEVIIDSDGCTEGSALIIPQNARFKPESPGFLRKDILLPGENPFLMGKSLTIETTADAKQQVLALPKLKEGEYAVYISYRSFPNSCSKVKYTVGNSQGKHEFQVNQKIGGGTWIYLGTFRFADNGAETSSRQFVSVSLEGDPGEVVSVDAIRFGGGMGNVARRPAATIIQNVRSVDDSGAKAAGAAVNPDQFSLKTSGKSRFREAGRYYLQYAGFPDSLVYSLNDNKNDYNDDYQSRGEWVNYLMGNPNGPLKNRKAEGLKIPVDLAFAFHTDAGITPDDSIIGTLGIYSTWADKGMFPDGSSRMASRDLSDLVQTQIVNDIRALFNPDWTRRGLWDKQYSESWRPNVPVMLLELLSHQNIADMKFGLDPRFQFTVGRAIYKGMLRFLAFQEKRNWVVQPLPVDHFALTLLGDTAVRLTWQPVADPLEPTAIPEKYKVYVQTNRNGFDDGIVVNDTTVVMPLKFRQVVYDFRISALNDGGESFPSETLSAGIADAPKGTVLVVNAFDRICAPAVFDAGSRAGIEWWNDQGVPWNYNTSFTGTQYDFNRKSEWTDDDNPGWGSSYGDMENERICGNTFDFTGIHGGSILHAGMNFVSVSDEVFCRENYSVAGFSSVDVVLGEEKPTPSLKDPAKSDFIIYTPGFMKKLAEISGKGGNIFLSGAYVGSDFALRKDTIAAKFAKETLHFVWRTGHASKGGSFYSTDYAKNWFNLKGNFNAGYLPYRYTVESPDGIEPAGQNAASAFRYGENNVSAGIVANGKAKCVVLGFPFETITDSTIRDEMMKQILTFFLNEK